MRGTGKIMPMGLSFATLLFLAQHTFSPEAEFNLQYRVTGGIEDISVTTRISACIYRVSVLLVLSVY